MAYSREHLVLAMKPRMRDFVVWWCLLRHDVKYGKPGRKYFRTRGKWISMVLDWAGTLVREGDPAEAKRSIFDAYRMNTYKVIKLASSRLAREGIADIPGVMDVAAEFMGSMESLRWLVSNGTFSDVVEYADEWFPLTEEMRRGSRGLK